MGIGNGKLLGFYLWGCNIGVLSLDEFSVVLCDRLFFLVCFELCGYGWNVIV